MKKRWWISFVILCILFLPGCAFMAIPLPTPEAETVILFTSDVQARVNENIGYAGVYSLRNSYLSRGNTRVLLVDAGDALGGDAFGFLSEGENVVALMNALDYTVAVPGDRDFDYGEWRLEALDRGSASFPYICCNFIDVNTGETVFDAYRVFTYENIKIGFVGITTPQTATETNPARFWDGVGNPAYTFCEDETGATLYAAVQSAVDGARAEGADVVIAVGHLGDGEAYAPWSSSLVIANTTGIDAFIDGHAEAAVNPKTLPNQNGENVLIAQTGALLSSVGALTVHTDRTLSMELISNVPAKDAQLQTYINYIYGQYQTNLQTVLTTIDTDLTICDGKGDTVVCRGETNLADMLADAFRNWLGGDVCLYTASSVCASLPAGDVTYADILKVLPNANEMCTVRLTGQAILDALEYGARLLPEDNGGLLQVSNLYYSVDLSVPSSVVTDETGAFVSVGQTRRVKNVYIAGELLSPDAVYTVAGMSYLLKNGGDGYTMFRDAEGYQRDTFRDSQIFISYVSFYLDRGVPREYRSANGGNRIQLLHSPR